jgi:RNA polymerase sigma-70 factor (TIGR02960 family)
VTGTAPEPACHGRPARYEPYPDALLGDLTGAEQGPEARYEAGESLALAFVAGLQRLPPRERAALVLRDVLGFPLAEVAGMLDCSEASVRGAVRRARGALDSRLPPRGAERAPQPRSARERALVRRFVAAFEDADVGRVVALLTDDARMTMPPEPMEYQGREAIAGFLCRSGWCGVRPVRLVPTRANGQPAFGCYLRDPETPAARAHGLIVLTLAGDQISAITRFGDTSLFPLFGLPGTLG